MSGFFENKSRKILANNIKTKEADNTTLPFITCILILWYN